MSPKDRFEETAELARVSVWIGEIQWMRHNGFGNATDPILDPLDTIECRDAILAPDGSEPDRPGRYQSKR